MPQQQSPFLEGKYGWNFGEGGWNTGMDENLLKFSFMFDRNVDGVVGSLPAAVSGQAYFLTTDNRLYFAVGTVWYSSPTPKWFEFKIRSTGDVYQFNGTSAVQVESPAGLDSRLDAVELTLSSLGTAAFEDVEFFATQAELDIVEAAAAAYTDELALNLANTGDPLKGSALVGYEGTTVHSKLDSISLDLNSTGTTDNLARQKNVNSLVRYDKQAFRLVGKALTSGFYDHFGLMDLLPTGELCMMFRRGTTHETDNGKIMFYRFKESGGWGDAVTVVEQVGLDFRDAAGGVMSSGRVIVATTSYDISGPTFPDIRIYASDDYGTSWTLKQSIPKGATNYRFVHGKGCQIGEKYVIPYYTQTDSTNALRLLETTDNGETWVEGATIYSGAVTYNEAGIVSLGGGWVLAVSRIGSGSGGLLRQFLSTDGGATWTDQGNVTSQNADASDTLVSPSLAYIVSDSGTPHVALFYTDRTTTQLVYRTIPVVKAIAGVVGWSEKRSVYSAPNLSGYQSHVVIGKRVLGNFFRETTPNAVAGAYQWEAYLGDLPDYESDWTAVTASTQYQFAHGLQRPPRRVVVEYAANSDPTQTFIVSAAYFNDGAHKGSGAQVAISGTNVTVGTGAAVWGTSYFAGIDATVGNRVTSGYYRVRAWL